MDAVVSANKWALHNQLQSKNRAPAWGAEVILMEDARVQVVKRDSSPRALLVRQ